MIERKLITGKPSADTVPTLRLRLEAADITVISGEECGDDANAAIQLRARHSLLSCAPVSGPHQKSARGIRGTCRGASDALRAIAKGMLLFLAPEFSYWTSCRRRQPRCAPLSR